MLRFWWKSTHGISNILYCKFGAIRSSRNIAETKTQGQQQKSKNSETGNSKTVHRMLRFWSKCVPDPSILYCCKFEKNRSSQSFGASISIQYWWCKKQEFSHLLCHNFWTGGRIGTPRTLWCSEFQREAHCCALCSQNEVFGPWGKAQSYPHQFDLLT